MYMSNLCLNLHYVFGEKIDYIIKNIKYFLPPNLNTRSIFFSKQEKYNIQILNKIEIYFRFT